jgi:hypothetical protein
MTEVEHTIFTEYDWKTFTDAYSLSLCSTSYGVEYKTLENYENKFGVNKHLFIKFIEKAFNEEHISYQVCLNDIVKMILNDGSRYSKEVIHIVKDVIDYLLEKGATFCEEILFAKRFEHASLEDEVVDFEIRARLIDLFHEKMDVTKFADWSTIVASNKQDIDHFGKKDFSESERFAYLKYYSKYLRNTYPNDSDDNSYSYY